MAKEAVEKALKDARLPYNKVEQAAVGYVYGVCWRAQMLCVACIAMFADDMNRLCMFVYICVFVVICIFTGQSRSCFFFFSAVKEAASNENKIWKCLETIALKKVNRMSPKNYVQMRFKRRFDTICLRRRVCILALRECNNYGWEENFTGESQAVVIPKVKNWSSSTTKKEEKDTVAGKGW